MIDPFHLEAYEKIAINYNRDVEVFPVLNELLMKIMGRKIYNSPTDLGVNMVGMCIKDDEVCARAAKQEIIRRYYDALVDFRKDKIPEDIIIKLDTIMAKADITKDDRPVVAAANKLAAETKEPAVAIELNDGTIVTGKTSKLMGSSSAALLNAAKIAAGVDDIKILNSDILAPIQELKTRHLKGNNPRLHTDETLIALAISSQDDENDKKTMDALYDLEGCEVHSSVILSEVDCNTFKKLGMHLTQEAVYQTKKLYHNR